MTLPDMTQVASPAPSATPTPPAVSPSGDWAARAADTIEQVVGKVRDRTTEPALTVTRAVVYGTFAVLVGVAALVLFIIAAVRLIDSYLPDAVFGEEHMWAAYLILGLAFVVAGSLLWLRRHSLVEDNPG
jgi:hypothetical protein